MCFCEEAHAATVGTRCSPADVWREVSESNGRESLSPWGGNDLLVRKGGRHPVRLWWGPALSGFSERQSVREVPAVSKEASVRGVRAVELDRAVVKLANGVFTLHLTTFWKSREDGIYCVMTVLVGPPPKPFRSCSESICALVPKRV